MPILILLTLSLSSRAQNSGLTSALEQFRTGKYCSEIRASDISRPSCSGYRNTIMPLHQSSAEELESLTFTEAGKAQTDKDRCVAQKARALIDSPRLFSAWRDLLGQTWLRLRKVKLVRDFCDENFLRQVHPTPSTTPDQLWATFVRQDRIDHQYPVEVNEDNPPPKNHALQEKREQVLHAWKDICLSRDSLDALATAEAFLPASLPLANAPELFRAMDDRRDLVTDFFSGRPLTDPQILRADLRTAGGIDIHSRPDLDDQLRQRLRDFANERESTAKQFDQTLRENTTGFSDKQKQYIYDEGTFDAVLARRMENLTPDRRQLAEGCMAANWKPSPAGATAEFAVIGAVTGVAYFAALEGLGLLRAAVGAARVARLSKAADAASLVRETNAYKLGEVGGGKRLFTSRNLRNASMAHMDYNLADQLVDACFGDFGNVDRLDRAPKPAPTGLDPHVGFQKANLELDPAKTPACQADAPRTLLVNTVEKSSCVGSVIDNGFSAMGTGLSLLREAPLL